MFQRDQAGMGARRRWLIALVLLLASSVGARWLYLEEQGNFHVITAGDAYRSAQMDRDELIYYIARHHIRSIINLRGRHQGSPWYEEELAVCRERGVKHYDVRLSAGRAPTAERVKRLLRLFKVAPRPVLIHCRAGADRAGLAAALWKLVVDGAPKAVARDQLSILYGHMPFGPTQALDQFIAQWPLPKGSGANPSVGHS